MVKFFGNNELVHMDGAEYIRVASLGSLCAIAEEMGLNPEQSHIVHEAIRELHARLQERMYKEIRSRIPDEIN
jgi:hypothetical protein